METKIQSEPQIKVRTLDEILSWWKKQTDGKFNLAHYLEVTRVRASMINQKTYDELFNTES
jgi:hypothetical protein